MNTITYVTPFSRPPMERALQSDLQPLGTVIGSLLRWSWAIALMGAAVGGGAWLLLADDGQEINTATARVGLTEATRWPFYDVELEAAQTIVNSAAFRTELEADLGWALEHLVADATNQLSVFDIEVGAGDPSTALEAANRAAELIIARSLSGEIDTRQAALETYDREIAELETQIAELRSRMDGVIPQLTAISAQRSLEDTPELRQQEFLLMTERDSIARILGDRERDVAGRQAARLGISATEPAATLRLVRPASLVGENTDETRAIVAGAALLAVLAAATGVVLLDRRRGPIRSLWQLSAIGGAETTLGIEAGPDASVTGISNLVDCLHRFSAQGSSLVGVIDSTRARIDVVALASLVTEEGLPAAAVETPVAYSEAVISFIDVSAEHEHPEATRRNSRRCDGLLILVDKRTGIRRASALIDRASANPGLVAAALVSAPPSR